MHETITKFRQRLDDGQICIGCGVTLADAAVTEALSPCVDFFWIDLEHTALSLESVQNHLIACRATGTAALVRVQGSGPQWIKPLLDIGAEGIIVPQITSAEEVRGVVAACRYPPQGSRGFGPRRAIDYGRQPVSEYIDSANKNIFVCAQVENAEALADIDAIAAVEGLDSIVIGPYDLSGSLGRLGDVTHTEVTSAIVTIVKKARAAGKFVGMGMARNPDHAVAAVELGAQWLQCGDDYGHMIGGATDLAAAVRPRIGG